MIFEFLKKLLSCPHLLDLSVIVVVKLCCWPHLNVLTRALEFLNLSSKLRLRTPGFLKLDSGLLPPISKKVPKNAFVLKYWKLYLKNYIYLILPSFKEDLKSFLINFRPEKSLSAVIWIMGNEQIFRNYVKHITATLDSTNLFNCGQLHIDFK